VALSLLGSYSKASTLTSSHFLLGSAPVVAAATSQTQSSLPLTGTQKTHQYKSFHEWKNTMVSSAELRAKQAQDAVMLKQRTSASTKDPNLNKSNGGESGLSNQMQTLQNQLEKEEYQLSLAKDLTISDYFVGYLTKQKDMSAAITEVSGRLTPEEVAELMSAYANNFFSTTRAATAPSSGSLMRAGSNQ